MSPQLPRKFQHFLTFQDYSAFEIRNLIAKTISIKSAFKTLKGQMDPFLQQKTLSIIFTKPSTRTRVSAETGWAAYGGHPLFLGQKDIQMGASGEPLDITGKVVSSMSDCILARLGSHQEIEILAKHSSVPVINALTDKFHPLQVLADLTLLQEQFGDKKIKVAWVGDANNILNSMLVTYPRLGIKLSIATPEGYPVDRSLIAKGEPVSISSDPLKACEGADVIMTDTWVSMGQEAEQAVKKAAFAGFQVTEEMGRVAKADWKFMHCLPRKPFEVDDHVFYGPRSLIYPQAENRKYSIMAIYEMLMRPRV